MSIRNKSAQTMRIDIDPGTEVKMATPAAQRKPSLTVYGHADDTYVSRRAQDGELEGDYARLLESVYDGVLITDQSGSIVDYNERAVYLFGFADADPTDANMLEMISGADAALLTTIRSNLEDSRHTMIDAACLRLDKTSFPAEIAVNQLEVSGVTRFSFFVRDISVRRRAQEALEEAVARLEQHDRNRSQFVSNVSHELRTPLTSMIYAVANMLKGVVGPLPDKLRKYLEMLDGDCKRLLGTVNDILDLRKIEDKTLRLSETRLPVARLVTRSAESLRVQAEQKDISLNITREGTGFFIDCDAQKMDRVLINIIGNAIKFTPAGGSVDVEIKADEEREGHVRCDIIDTGIGIPKEALPNVTMRHFTVGEQASGSGLGLALSKEIVAMHRGILEIESPPPGREKGTMVSLSLALVDAPTVLVVDDEKGIRDLLEIQISAPGYNVVMATDGEEALKLVAEAKPDIMILDMAMPKMDGTEVILKMKSDKSMMRIPIIVLTGAHADRAKAEIFSSFAIPALSKPWQDEELLNTISGALIGVSVLSTRKK
jgi:PAS domain S-box-containing protein